MPAKYSTLTPDHTDFQASIKSPLWYTKVKLYSLIEYSKTMSPRQSAPLALEYILLGLLDQQPMHGYDLYRQLAAMDGIPLIWYLKQSMLYALLDKLEENNLLSSTIIPGETRPSRKQYQLTEGGRSAFQTWMQSPVSHGRDMRQDFLARLFFTCRSGNEATRSLIEQQKEVCQGWLRDFENQYQNVNADSRFDRFVINFRISQARSMYEWLLDCEQELE